MQGCKRPYFRSFLLVLSCLVLILTTACGRIGEAIDPAEIGYEIEVTYDALGGKINQREQRFTNYAKNSLLFEPAGSSNLLVAPVKSGYTLAGWYTACKEIPGENGGEVRYEFDPQDRWDFKVDRVQENTTLYARWVNQAKAEYIDAGTEEVVFTKDLTPSSPLAALSPGVLKMVAKTDHEFLGYFAEDLENEINFDEYEYSPLLPSDEVLYKKLADEFPRNFIEYRASEEELEQLKTAKKAAAIEEKADALEADTADAILEANASSADTSWLFLHEYGYDLKANASALAKIKRRKNEIIEEYIEKYIKNNEHNRVYLVFEGELEKKISLVDDLANGDKCSFQDIGKNGRYVIESDLDFSGKEFASTKLFSSKIDGQGHTLSNVTLKISPSKKDSLSGVQAALFQELAGAHLENINFANLTIEVNLPAGANSQVAALAVDAHNSTLKNISFQNLTIRVKTKGKVANCLVSDFVLNPESCDVSGINGGGVNLDLPDVAEVQRNY